MTDIEASQAAAEAVPDEAAAVPPEPMTAQERAGWNAYYDVYVAAFVLALAFLASANKIPAINSGLWSQLQAGRQIAEAGTPVGVGGGTLAAEGSRWINIPWLFELANYELFRGVSSLAPPADRGGPEANAPLVRGEQAAAGALIAVNALLRALAAWLLLGLRRKGPGLWWAAFCVTMAVGVTIGPAPVEAVGPVGTNGAPGRVFLPTIGIQLGGIVGPATVTPESWGLLLLAAELVLLHGASNLGRGGRIYALIPLLLLWANVDESFAFGLLILLAATVGRALDARRAAEPGRPTPRAMLVVLLASFAATFVTPTHVFGVLASFAILLRAVGIQPGVPSLAPTAILGKGLIAEFGAPFARVFQFYFLALIGLGLGSFALNRRRFSAERFLVFVAAGLTWGLALVYAGPFAAVLVLVLALNGQEWYHDTFGTEGRLGAGWGAWSVGGRAVTIALVSLAIFQATTGWGGQVGGSRFGFGFDPDDFPFEAAEAITAAPLEGNVLNTTFAQGDVLAWRSGGRRKPYIDNKQHLYPREALQAFEKLRIAIRDDKVEDWQPLLDEAKVTCVMLQTAAMPVTYAKLMNSPNWVPFYDDGAVSMFGRKQAPAFAGDVAYFESNRLEAAGLAYRRPKPPPDWAGTPRQVVEAVDKVFQNRLLDRTQPHVEAAQRWLRPASVAPGADYLPDPAHCLLAIRELRTALARKPDDPIAYRLLIEAYRLLLAQESALIAGIAPSPENIPRIVQAPTQPGLLSLRTQQLLTAMNFALQTLPPARSAADRVERAELNYNLAELYRQTGALDLSRDHLLRINEISLQPGELPDAFFQDLTKRLGAANQQITQVQDQLSELTARQRLTPQDKANVASSGGAPGLAIAELAEAEGINGAQSGVRPLLVDLYVATGQPEKALDLIATLTNVDDPSLSSGPGTAAHRQALVYLLAGNYRNAVSLWVDRAIGELRTQRLMETTSATQTFLKGEAVGATRMFLELPEKVDQQASWEFELALAALEGGLPADVAAEHFATALELEPSLAVRPVIAYYLEQLGKPVPPPRPARATAPAAAPAAATSPGTSEPSATPAAPASANLPPNPFGLPTPGEAPKP